MYVRSFLRSFSPGRLSPHRRVKRFFSRSSYRHTRVVELAGLEHLEHTTHVGWERERSVFFILLAGDPKRVKGVLVYAREVRVCDFFS